MYQQGLGKKTIARELGGRGWGGISGNKIIGEQNLLSFNNSQPF